MSFENPLFWQLHRLSLQYLDSSDKNEIQKGKEILLKMNEIKPNHPIALYNLACAESLLGNTNEALSTLDQAIDAGYHDLYHMINDKDFDNIKNLEGFCNLVEKVKNIVFPEEKVKENVQEKVEEKVQEKVEEKVQEKVEEIVQEKVEEKVQRDSLEEKIETLSQIFPIPREILKELLITYKGNVEEIIEKLL